MSDPLPPIASATQIALATAQAQITNLTAALAAATSAGIIPPGDVTAASNNETAAQALVSSITPLSSGLPAQPPIVAAVVPASGTPPPTVTVYGAGFAGVSNGHGNVSFVNTATSASVAATGINVVNDSQIVANVPATLAAGTYDVVVTSPAGTSAKSAADQFTVA